VIGGFRHAGIAVRDMETSLAFYRDVLGLPVVSDRISAVAGDAAGAPGCAARICVLAVTDSAVHVELLEYRGAGGTPVAPRPFEPGAAHASFWVADIAALYERLKANRVPTLSPPIAQTSGRLKLYASDPDGFWLELTEGPG
jgi:catechol 2,3-dioxygenase-like lactoylglutathione lyase family enzyme